MQKYLLERNVKEVDHSMGWSNHRGKLFAPSLFNVNDENNDLLHSVSDR
jgi:hypothetical protein